LRYTDQIVNPPEQSYHSAGLPTSNNSAAPRNGPDGEAAFPRLITEQHEESTTTASSVEPSCERLYPQFEAPEPRRSRFSDIAAPSS